jgi:uncharacterized membrane protein
VLEERAPGSLEEAASEDDRCIRLGLIVTPSLSPETVTELTRELGEILSRRYPSVCWELPHIRDPLVTPPVALTEMVDAARRMLLAEDWDLVVCVTDLPLRLSRRPLLTHASPTHGVALVSLPALGVRRVNRRLVDSISMAVTALVGDEGERVQRRLTELAEHADDAAGSGGVTFLARVVTGNVQLILGMIRANRPWRLVAHLDRALLGAIAAGSAALVVSDVWLISASLDTWRLVVLTVASVAVAVVTLIKAHELWERADDPRTREQVMLFNLVTLVTVAFGLLTLYAVTFVVSLSGAALLIDSSVFEHAVGHPAHAQDYLRLAWLASSLSTVGGALGGVLESDAAVREAAYAHRPEDE